MNAVYDSWRRGEMRAFSRAAMQGQLAAGAMGGTAEYFEKIIKQGEKFSIPDPFTELEGSLADGLRTPEKPYPIPPAAAAGLVEALTLGLLDGPLMATWPATPEGLPLSRVWGRIEARVG